MRVEAFDRCQKTIFIVNNKFTIYFSLKKGLILNQVTTHTSKSTIKSTNISFLYGLYRLILYAIMPTILTINWNEVLPFVIL